MNFSLSRFLLLPFLAAALLGSAGKDYSSPSEMQNAPTWQARQEALHNVLKHYPLSDPATQAGIVKLFERESNDPEWGDLEEGLFYENYYEEVSDACQKVAETYGSKAAWYALVHSNYNADSLFGLWLASLPESLPLLLSMSNSNLEVERDRATVMLAEALQRCYQANAKDCFPVLAKRDVILLTVREKARSIDPTFAVVALGVCGTAEDLLLLQELASQPHPRGVNPNDETDRTSFLAIIGRSQQQITARVKRTAAKP